MHSPLRKSTNFRNSSRSSSIQAIPERVPRPENIEIVGPEKAMTPEKSETSRVSEPNLTNEYAVIEKDVVINRGRNGFGFVVLSKMVDKSFVHHIGRIIKESEASRRAIKNTIYLVFLLILKILKFANIFIYIFFTLFCNFFLPFYIF